MNPFDWIMIAMAAVIAAAAVFVLAPAAGPIAAGIGTWIGGMFGFSGVAATNFGLALLGGGSIASGGFGMAGGVALLTAAFSFGTDIVVDYSARSLFERYQYQQFAEASRQMTTLPVPRNESGPDSYEAAFVILSDIKTDMPLSSDDNRTILEHAIAASAKVGTEHRAVGEAVREETMLSLLYFLANDYISAQKRALVAEQSARGSDVNWTLAAFVLAASRLYDEEIDWQSVLPLFNYSIVGELDNPLTPLLFSVFLDRMMYRMNDGALATSELREVATVGQKAKLEDRWLPVQTVLLSRYILRIKIEQQKIGSLSASSNQTIRNDPLTLEVAKKSLAGYSQLLNGANFVAGGIAGASVISDKSIPEEARNLTTLLEDYSRDRGRLEALVDGLEAHQANRKAELAEPGVVRKGEPFATREIWSWILLSIISLAAGFAAGRRGWRKSQSG